MQIIGFPLQEITGGCFDFMCTVDSIFTWIQSYQGAITAVSTFFIAIFTIVLAKSTTKLWSAGTEALKTTERAFVSIDGFDYELTTAADKRPEALTDPDFPKDYLDHLDLYITRFAISPRWRNQGNTPTKGMTVQINWGETVETSPGKFNYETDPRSFFIPPKATERDRFIDIPQARAHIEHIVKRADEKPILLIWGHTDYWDVFDRRHFLEWCYQIRFDNHKGQGLKANFIQWGEYNRTDYDTKV